MNRHATAGVLAALLTLTAAHAQSFTYQGVLTDSSGNPVNAPQDFQFTIFTAASGGAAIGAVTTTSDVFPENGRFTATVSPGAGVFTGADRWLQVSVRPTGSPTYTILLPRQKLTPTPYALRSLSDRWKDAGASATTNDPALGNAVFLNRVTPISGADFFTVSTPTGPGNYGGMYVETQSGTGLPFYGYATNNVARAWTYVNGSDGTWRLNVGGDRMFVSNTGKVGIATNPSGPETLQVNGAVAAAGVVTALNHTYTTPRTRYLSIGAEAFHPQSSATLGNFGGEPLSNFAYLDTSVGSGFLFAPVHLPHAAVISAVTFYLVDGSTSVGVRGALLRRSVQFRTSEIISEASTSGSTGDAAAYAGYAPQFPIVDNTAYTYFASAWCSDWQGSSTAIASVVITYTVTEPD